MSREERSAYAKERQDRILTFITQDPPVPFENIRRMEGITDKTLRQILKELEAEHDLKYLDTPGSKSVSTVPHGLTQATARLRSNLANELYRLTNPHNQFGVRGREEAASLTGLNPREQIRAEEKPFAFDWSLAQIERLARALGENEWEFLLKCTTT